VNISWIGCAAALALGMTGGAACDKETENIAKIMLRENCATMFMFF
jgi:hypothetical protein